MHKKKYIILASIISIILTMYFLGEYGFTIICTPISADTFLIAGVTVLAAMVATDGVNSTIENSQKAIEKQLKYHFAKQYLPIFEIKEVSWNIGFTVNTPIEYERSEWQQFNVDDDDFMSKGFILDLDTKRVDAFIKVKLKNTSDHIAYNVYGETDNLCLEKENILPKNILEDIFDFHITENYKWVSYAQEAALGISTNFDYNIYYSNLQGGKFASQ